MKILAVLVLIFLSSCTAIEMQNCKQMCPNGVKSYDGKICSCLTQEDFKK